MRRRKHPVTQHRLRAVGQHAWSKMQFREEEGHEDRRRWRTPSIIMVWSSCAGGKGLSPVGDDALGKCWRSSDRRASLGSGGYPPTQWANQPLGNPKHPSRERNPALLDAFFISTSTFSANRAFPGKYNSANIFSICAAGWLDTQSLYYKLPVRLSASFWTTSTQ